MNTLTDLDVSEVLIDTRELNDAISLTWRIPNFSEVLPRYNLEAKFTLTTSGTTWKFELNLPRTGRIVGTKPPSIRLERTDEKTHDVYCTYECCLKTISKTYEKKTSYAFDLHHPFTDLLTFDHHYEFSLKRSVLTDPIEFEKDVFKFRFSMKLRGPLVTKIAKSAGFLKPNFEKLSNDFRNLLESKEYCDITISVGCKTLPVHKAVLCARSVVFHRMLQNDMQENKNQLIKIDDSDFGNVKDFIMFLYTGELEIYSTDKAMDLYYIADKYDVGDLREKCASYLEFNLSVEEACSILKLADLHKDDKLKDAVIFFMQMHTSAIKLTDGWKNLIEQQPKLAFQVLK